MLAKERCHADILYLRASIATAIPDSLKSFLFYLELSLCHGYPWNAQILIFDIFGKTGVPCDAVAW